MLIVVIIILVVSLLAVGLIIVRKFPQLVSIDVDQIPQERQRQVKSQIIEQRVSRRVQGWTSVLVDLFGPTFKKISIRLNHWYHRVIKLEKYYKERSQKVKFIKEQPAELASQTTDDQIKKAWELIGQNKLLEAENIFIEVVSSHPKNIKAYHGLAEVYYIQKDLEHSTQIYEHILKIDPQNSQSYAGLAKIALEQDYLEEAQKGFAKAISLPRATLESYLTLGKVYEKMSQNDKALEVYKSASQLEPNNPKVLDLLLEACILNKKRVPAKSAFNKLKKANPDNQKLDEFKKRIDEI